MLSFAGKFNRKYVLRIETGDNSFVEITDPITLEFTVTRTNLGSTNTATFVIYNLSNDTRFDIFKDVYDVQTQRSIQLFAGYADGKKLVLPRVFNGNIKRAYSHRQMTDVRTEIEAFDGQISMLGNVSMPIPAGVASIDIVKEIVKALPAIETSTIGKKFLDKTTRSSAVMGNPVQLLNQLTNNGFYIDSQSAYALSRDEVLMGDVRTINYKNGLLGTPKKMETYVELEMLFEPRIKPSQYVTLESETNSRLNGLYKVTGITHRGVISGAVGGDCRTVLTMEDLQNYTIVRDNATDEWKVVQQ